MFEMTFYCSRQADGTIHIQNAAMGYLGQHHVHTPEDFEKWRDGDRVVSLALGWFYGMARRCPIGVQNSLNLGVDSAP